MNVVNTSPRHFPRDLTFSVDLSKFASEIFLLARLPLARLIPPRLTPPRLTQSYPLNIDPSKATMNLLSMIGPFMKIRVCDWTYY